MKAPKIESVVTKIGYLIAAIIISIAAVVIFELATSIYNRF